MAYGAASTRPHTSWWCACGQPNCFHCCSKICSAWMFIFIVAHAKHRFVFMVNWLRRRRRLWTMEAWMHRLDDSIAGHCDPWWQICKWAEANVGVASVADLIYMFVICSGSARSANRAWTIYFILGIWIVCVCACVCLPRSKVLYLFMGSSGANAIRFRVAEWPKSGDSNDNFTFVCAQWRVPVGCYAARRQANRLQLWAKSISIILSIFNCIGSEFIAATAEYFMRTRIGGNIVDNSTRARCFSIPNQYLLSSGVCVCVSPLGCQSISNLVEQ